jgi:hypothetical protein
LFAASTVAHAVKGWAQLGARPSSSGSSSSSSSSSSSGQCATGGPADWPSLSSAGAAAAAAADEAQSRLPGLAEEPAATRARLSLLQPADGATVDGTVAHSAGGRWLVSEALPDDALLDVLAYCGDGASASGLLRVSLRWALRLRKRQAMWRALCLRASAGAWRGRLPSRPRKPWCDVFAEFLGREEAERRRRSDEVLRKAESAFRGSDNVVAVRKLVDAAKAAFGFSVDHQSGVLFESNPLLNLAVLKGKRHKVAQYLLVECGASVHLADRGGFTPLLDAAFSGDLVLVRLLLAFGADPEAKGHSHFSGGIKTVELDAVGWAAAKGHAEAEKHLREWLAADPAVIASVAKRARAAATATATAAGGTS